MQHQPNRSCLEAWNQLPQLDGYLVEVMWLANAKDEVYTKFFDFVKSVYHLDGTCEFHTPTALLNCIPQAPSF